MAKWQSIFISLITILITIPSDLSAREKFNFSLGKEVNILSDKAFRRSREGSFEAVGNVIITHSNNAIYGEKATLSFITGETEVVGNVKYVGPLFTMSGSRLNYNVNDQTLVLENARVESDNYVVLGKKIEKIGANTIIANQAEYTTCQDCPESWSIFGERVHITVGEYVRVWHANIKVKGVPVLYIPYIILPIKKDRETGLLFPRLAFKEDEGVRFQQPWFWNISENADMTLSPSIFGKRGWGNEYQFRHVLKEKSWYQFESLQSFDQVYLPESESLNDSGKNEFRHFSQFETHYSSSEHFNGHLHWTSVRDMDVVRDFDFYALDRTSGPDFENGGFFESRTSLYNLTLEAYFNQNQLFSKADKFDKTYVQTLPKVSLDTSQFSLLRSRIFGFRKIHIGLNGDVTRFGQLEKDEGEFIRNATRFNLVPYLNWYIGDLGPVHLNSKVRWDYQHYRFPYERVESFSKSGAIYESEMSFEIDRIYGLAYKEVMPAARVKTNDKTEPSSLQKFNRGLIGTLPPLPSSLDERKYEVSKSSFRHSQVFKFKHYFLADQELKGNQRFRNQIEESAGQFDRIDAIREKEHENTQVTGNTALPFRNTVEFQWNNSLINKSVNHRPYSFGDGRVLRDNFDYGEVAHFNVSQGIDLDEESAESEDKLTRLAVSTGFSFSGFTISGNEFYFYKENRHIFNIDMFKSFKLGKLGTRINYNPFSVPVTKFATFYGDYHLSDLFHLAVGVDYDYENDKTSRTRYSGTYSPVSNCWKFQLVYDRIVTETRYSFNVFFNFNDSAFNNVGY